MSLNLYIKFDNQNIEIYQTPTYITLMCLMTDTGPKFQMRGKQAKRAVNCYLQYVQSLSRISDPKRRAYQHINKHVEEIQSLLQSAKKMEVYLL